MIRNFIISPVLLPILVSGFWREKLNAAKRGEQHPKSQILDEVRVYKLQMHHNTREYTYHMSLR